MSVCTCVSAHPWNSQLCPLRGAKTVMPGSNARTDLGFYVPSSSERYHGSLENWLIARRGKAKYQMRLKHLVIRDSQEVPPKR